MRTLAYIVLTIILFILLEDIKTYQPEMLNEFLIKVDVFGLTDGAHREQQRLYDINNLGSDVTYDQKQVLINKTVFMGASAGMVRLALGEPKRVVQKMWEERKIILTYYVYYVRDDKRPTVLVFQDDKLINAYKGSALDVEK